MNNNTSFKLYLISFFLILFIISTIILVFLLYNSNKEKNNNINLSYQNQPSEINTLKSNTNQNTNMITESNNAIIKKSDAEKIAKSTYKTAYNILHDESSKAIIAGEYSINGENKFGYKIDFSKLETIFSKKLIEKMKSQLIEINEEYYDFSSAPSFYEKLDLSSIFGSTDQSIRPIKVIIYTDNLIVAEGQLSSDENDDIIDGQLDNYPLYIIFVKSNNKWLIDLYE